MRTTMSKKIPISSIPELLKIWDWEANKDISPCELGKRSDTKVWWICPYGHEHYLQSPHQKTSHNAGCPKCGIEHRVQSNKTNLIKRFGSLSHTHPEIVVEWDYKKNHESPDNVLANSHTKFWWVCSKCGESFYMSPNQRVGNNRGCSKCGIKQRSENHRLTLIKKYGSLAITNPNIAKEWDYTLNIDSPQDVHKGMPEKRWWICQKGHTSYYSSIRDRVRRGYGCPICQGEAQTSFPEQALFYYIKKFFADAINRYSRSSYELDVFIPSLNVGIEYDGLYWHKDSEEQETVKDKYYYDRGIIVYHIKESVLVTASNSDRVFYYKYTPDYANLKLPICAILLKLGITAVPDIDVVRDRQEIWVKYLSNKNNNSLQARFPEIAAEWDYDKNTISPWQVTGSSNRKVAWICKKCGNHFEMQIQDRTGSKKCGCPICGKQKLATIQAKVKQENIRKIRAYREANPASTKSECARALKLSYPTVRKYWEF